MRRQGVRELRSIETRLRNSPHEWKWYAAQFIAEIPSGKLTTYGCISDLIQHRHGYSPGPRQVGQLRGELYDLLGHETMVPLHRVAKQSDLLSAYDSPTTRQENDRRRDFEGTPLDENAWWYPEELGVNYPQEEE